MDEVYLGRYDSLYREHWWWRAREGLVLRAVRGLGARGNVLEVGCGAGWLFPALEQLGEVEGVEIDPGLAALDPARRDRIHVMPFDERFRPGKRYALVLMLDVLEHMAQPAAALRHVARLLDDGGHLVLTVPAFNRLWTAHDDLNGHLRRYTRRAVARLFDAAGLRLVRARYFFHWLALAKLALRAKEGLLGGVPRAPRVPPAAVNRALLLLSRLEPRLLGPLGLPFGSSLLAVARRTGSP